MSFYEQKPLTREKEESSSSSDYSDSEEDDEMGQAYKSIRLRGCPNPATQKMRKSSSDYSQELPIVNRKHQVLEEEDDEEEDDSEMIEVTPKATLAQKEISPSVNDKLETSPKVIPEPVAPISVAKPETKITEVLPAPSPPKQTANVSVQVYLDQKPLVFDTFVQTTVKTFKDQETQKDYEQHPKNIELDEDMIIEYPTSSPEVLADAPSTTEMAI